MKHWPLLWKGGHKSGLSDLDGSDEEIEISAHYSTEIMNCTKK